MKYTVIYEASIKLHEEGWIRIGLNQEFDSDQIPHDRAWKLVQEKVEQWIQERLYQDV